MAKSNRSRRYNTLLQAVLFAGILLLVNILANARLGDTPMYGFLDLTEEKRYTLTKPTRQLLRGLEEPVYVRILLEGDFPAEFKRLQNATRELLDDFRAENGLIEYEFADPNEGTVEEINALREELAKDGIIPSTVTSRDASGVTEKLVYPHALVNFKGRMMPVLLLENEVPGVDPEVAINQSIALLEYKFANALQKLQYREKPNILFTAGHGELDDLETRDLEKSMRLYYNTGRVVLDSIVSLNEEVAALVIAKPTRRFSEKDKFKIDQYVMNGGKVLWLLDKLAVGLDSLRGRPEFFPQEYDHNLDDLLFRYGLRIQPNLVLDINCSQIPLVSGMVGNAPQFTNFEYPYHLVVVPDSPHPAVKNLGPLNLLYANTLDTSVQPKYPLKKEVLLHSSKNSRTQFIPVGLNFEFLRYGLDPDKFNKPPQPLALSLEGQFASLYENRVTESMLEGLAQLDLAYKAKSTPTRMLVVSDGDIAKNPVNRRENKHGPLGYNRFQRYTFANKAFLLNAIEYLLDENLIIEARAKEVKLRLLDRERTRAEARFWQGVNIGLPLVVLALFGLAYQWIRRRRYSG